MALITCRACLKKGVKMKSLFAFGIIYGKKMSLKEVLLSCAKLQILEKDGLPQNICPACIQQIEKAYSFRMMCEKNEKTLKQQIKDNLESQGNESVEDPSAGSSNLNEFTDGDGSIAITNEQNDNDVIKLINDEEQKSIPLESKQNDKKQCEIAIPKLQQSHLHQISPNGTSKQVYAIKQHGRYSCQFCKTSYKLKASLELHIIRNHSSIPKSDPATLICNICSKQCQTPDHYKRHMNFHKTGKEYHCDECGRDFSQQRTFICHMYSHTGERPVLCPECGKTFKTNVDLGIHMRAHLNIYPYICKICGQKFRYSSRFTIHKRRHAGEKPFECPFCDKKFICSDRLIMHKRTHTGEKPFACKICGKAFARSSALKVHSQTHTGEKPHICTICNRGFSQAHCLRSHMKIHEKEGSSVQKNNEEQVENNIQFEAEVIIDEINDLMV